MPKGRKVISFMGGGISHRYDPLWLELIPSSVVWHQR